VVARADDAWEVLRSVLDPEVPALSVVDLGIVRDLRFDESGAVVVRVTPTYSGCPAMQVIERDIVKALNEGGFESARVETVYQPAWTTDWITPEGRNRLREYGIAPPGPRDSSDELVPNGWKGFVVLSRLSTAVRGVQGYLATSSRALARELLFDLFPSSRALARELLFDLFPSSRALARDLLVGGQRQIPRFARDDMRGPKKSR
jgi:phenylacetate-CoA oxygenase PaaJ subunit